MTDTALLETNRKGDYTGKLIISGPEAHVVVVAGRCGCTPDLPKENKNHYSVRNKKNRVAEESEAGLKQSKTVVNHTGDMR